MLLDSLTEAALLAATLLDAALLPATGATYGLAAGAEYELKTVVEAEPDVAVEPDAAVEADATETGAALWTGTGEDADVEEESTGRPE